MFHVCWITNSHLLRRFDVCVMRTMVCIHRQKTKNTSALMRKPRKMALPASTIMITTTVFSRDITFFHNLNEHSGAKKSLPFFN